jgi:DNA topoisomerase-1
VTVHPDGIVEFDFLGKDSVPWHKEIHLPPLVRETLEELIDNARPPSSAGNGDGFHPTRDLPQLFPDIGSRNVNAFLSRIHEDLSAKMFRTYHATRAVCKSLEASGVRASDPEYVKWRAATLANLEAAILCNHTKKDTGNWEARKQRYEERTRKAQARRERYLEQLAEQEEALQVLVVEATTRRSLAQSELDKVDPADEARHKRAATQLARVKRRYEKRVATAKKRVATAKGRVERAEQAIGKIRAQMESADHKRTWNLGTSLKSYIDPRVYYRWGQQVDYDVLEKYYPKALRRKFAWARDEDGSSEEA